MADQWWRDDEELLAALRVALRADDVPPRLLDLGTAAYTWRNIDAELAVLTYDSVLETVPAAVRSDPASLRSLTFASAELTIELELTSDALLGQLVLPQAGQVEVCQADGEAMPAAIDETGCFMIRPVPRGPFRLHCRVAYGHDVLTEWFTL